MVEICLFGVECVVFFALFGTFHHQCVEINFLEGKRLSSGVLEGKCG